MKEIRFSHQTIVSTFALVVFISLSSLVYFSSRNEIQIKFAPQTFFKLFTIFQQEGYQRFTEEKRTLKAQVERTLKSPPSEEEEQLASNIALYLFPDALPDTNFEKQVAMEQWAPLEAAIEKAPRTKESRLWFDEMRANIWNYENPKLGYSTISPYAKEVLRIYNELSAP